MTVVDWVIVAFVLAVAFWGFREGAAVGVLLTGVTVGFGWLVGALALHGPVTPEVRRIDPAPSLPGRVTPVAPPDAGVAADPDVRRAGRAVVRVLGTACGLGVEGSGWVAAPAIVVTNAHVVAGVNDVSAITRGGASLTASVVRFDTRNDLALLSVGAELPPLTISPRANRGVPGAVLGYPQNGPYTAIAARLGETRPVISEDSYGRGPIRRTIGSLRGRVRSGNSGGPIVDRQGRVLGTVFAATTSGPVGGFAIPNTVVRRALRSAAASPLDTGPCTR